MNREIKKILFLLLAMVMLIIFGTTGYILLLKISFIDALYMTIITLSTVGFKEVAELNAAGKIFTMLIITGGISTAAYTLTYLASFVLGGEFREILRRRAMENTIQNLRDHYILCGVGQTGMSVIKRFQKSNVKYIAIEKDEEKVNALLDENILVIHGDATSEETLEKAGIQYAKGMVTSLSNDADNVFTVLTAKGMRSDLHIVSRAIGINAHAKLKRAGADHTISPNELGGDRMATLLLRPAVVSFLDITTQLGEMVFDIEEVTISVGSPFAGMSLKDSRIREITGLNVLAIQKLGEENIHLNPDSNEHIKPGDKLLVLGQLNQIEELKKIESLRKP
ncbi:MAG: potassium channel protein [Eubacteriaceae bacterium]|nr:potassium channel protein [Eubacteriaceae bacterium]